MRLAAKIDANQPAIVAALRAIGCVVESLAQVGDGMPDLIVGCQGRYVFLEIKDGSKPPSERRLTPAQEKFHAKHAGLPVFVVTSVDEAIAAVRVR